MTSQLPLSIPAPLPGRCDAPSRYMLNGRPVAGAAADVNGRPSWWSRQTHGRRMPAATMAEARERAAADARATGAQC